MDEELTEDSKTLRGYLRKLLIKNVRQHLLIEHQRIADLSQIIRD